MYVNTPGTSTPDGRAIGFETEAFAISDCMNYIKPPVYTIGVGQVLQRFVVVVVVVVCGGIVGGSAVSGAVDGCRW